MVPARYTGGDSGPTLALFGDAGPWRSRVSLQRGLQPEDGFGSPRTGKGVGCSPQILWPWVSMTCCSPGCGLLWRATTKPKVRSVKGQGVSSRSSAEVGSGEHLCAHLAAGADDQPSWSTA